MNEYNHDHCGSSRIHRAFASAKEHHRPAFIAYITCGDPTLDRTRQLAVEFAGAGVDILELGVPFTDPMADGTANQEAALRALAKGVTLRHVLRTTEALRGEGFGLPVVLFTYYNPVFAYGVEKFAVDAVSAGADGVLLVDVPVEEAQEFKPAFDGAGLGTIFLVAPTTGDRRLPHILELANGFVYCVSRSGVTGERNGLASGIRENVARVRRLTQLPVAVGFGISSREQVSEIGQFADGVVVGSAIVRRIGEGGDTDEMVRQVTEFVRTLTGQFIGG
ncbi:MAG TPA: tryptophan synthase subunit alpha [Candidatus Latescibacteria bacterium]|nr:tryptophan synthase subunit alpha [Candidatus Latescibacterota bacterium]